MTHLRPELSSFAASMLITAAKTKAELEAREKAALKDPYIDMVGLTSPLRKYKREIPRKTTKDVVILLLFVPLWLCVLLLGASYQVTMLILRKLGIVKISQPCIDSGHKAPETLKPRPERKYDIVVLGVTGFTGRLAARHLAQQHGVKGDKVKWAIAGRSQTKLNATKQSLADELKLPELVDKIDTILVDTSDPKTMPGLVEDTRAVATTAGPFQEYGNAVVEFCAKYGTHYTDITGEVGWVKAMIAQWGETAKKTGAKIVPFCGHDSIPWDLTVYKLNNLLKETFQEDLETVKIWDEVVGDAPGGTYVTVLLNLEGKGVQSPRCKVDPFLQLVSDGSKSTHSTKEDLPVLIEPFFDGRWSGPFVMAAVNSKIVRWTHALRQQGDKKMSYREVMIYRDWKTALWFQMQPIMTGSLMLSPFTKWLFHALGMPRPGQGPSYEKMEKTNYLLVTAEGLTSNQNRAESTLYFPKDAGCLETAKMMVESGLALAWSEKKGGKELPSGSQGGFWPPAAALGDVLLGRLIATGVEYQCRTAEKPVLKKKEGEEKPKDKDA